MSDEDKIPMVVTSIDIATTFPVPTLTKDGKIFVKEPDSLSATAAEQWAVNLPEGENLQPFIDSFYKQQTVKVSKSWLEHVRVVTE